ncbi:hypothetical protein KAJ87_02245 [Candidatus Pacearchaeota archaeon]|nr:hypothetical protein [Candidatus Pacearchaeota archaeon]
MKSKTGAMEMSVGTIVTIVLLMSVLVLGVFLVNKIFSGATSSVDEIDQEVKKQISELFSADETKGVIVYPPSRKIEIKKGEEGKGFAFSIRNKGDEKQTFEYIITAEDTTCSISKEEATEYIALGGEGEKTIGAGQIMEYPVLVTFNLPESAPPCNIKYKLLVECSTCGTDYPVSDVDIDLLIKGK